MPPFNSNTPVVMTLSSHDPTGSTGIQADIETVASLGCHCTPIITALCARDTRDLKDLIAIDAAIVIEQARAVLEDMNVSAIKLGYMGSVHTVEAVHTILRDYPNIPVVLNPVVSLCDSKPMEAHSVAEATRALLLPLATIATPDLVEAHRMSQQADTIDACAQEILENGCQYVLISGAKRTQSLFVNNLYGQHGLIKHYQWERLNIFSHGCGTIQATGIASYLAHGLHLSDAVEQGQQFTWHALAASRRLGMGKGIPNRFYWADKNNTSKRIKHRN